MSKPSTRGKRNAATSISLISRGMRDLIECARRILPYALLALAAIGPAAEGRPSAPQGFIALSGVAMCAVSGILHWQVFEQMADDDATSLARSTLTAMLAFITIAIGATVLLNAICGNHGGQ